MARPRVVVYQGASVDGRLTLASDVLLLFGDERWKVVTGSICVASPTDEVYEWLKLTHRPQAILEGSGSFVKSDAEPDPLPSAACAPGSLY